MLAPADLRLRAIPEDLNQRRLKLKAAARLRAAQFDFPTFLHYVMLEEVILGPDGEPTPGGAIQMELWPHLVERAQSWGAGQDEVILKARQLGLSWLAAAFAVWTALKPGGRVLLLSKTEDDAFELLGKCEYIFEHLPAQLQLPLEVDNKGTLEFEGGGVIKALPSTQNAGRGFTARLVIVDEAAFHQWAQQNFKAYRATVADGGQLLILSTANGVGGFFWDRWQLAVRYDELAGQIQRGNAPAYALSEGFARALKTAAVPVFIPWFARPDRDQAWLEKERLQYAGLPEEFSQEYPGTADEAFIQLTGLVYPQFSPARHVIDFEPVPWGECLYRYGSYDQGGGDPSVMGTFGVWRRPDGLLAVHQYGELYKRTGAITVDEAAAFFLAWHRVAPFTVIEPDPADATLQASLANMGLPVDFSSRYTRQEGLGIHAWWLDNDRFTIGSHCRDGINEYHQYRWAQRVDPNSKDRYKTNTPHDHHGDGIDTKRLALTRIYYDLLAIASGRRATRKVRQ